MKTRYASAVFAVFLSAASFFACDSSGNGGSKYIFLPGSNGADGLSPLVTVTEEPAGANCSYGGQKISSGLDRNANGVLGAAEVTSVQYVCNGGGGATLSSDKAIKAFGFLSPAVTGTINEADHTISVTVPYGTSVNALTPVINYTGASIAPDWGFPQDFTDQVIYTVTAEDSTTQDYTVTVTVAASDAKEITAYSFTSPAAIGVIAGTSIAVSVPYGTNVTALVATFTTTGAGVTVVETGLEQTSGTTPNNFTTSRTYRVRAVDTTMRDYTVTVTPGSPSPYRVTYSVGAFDTTGTVPVDSNNYAPGATVTVLGNTGNLAGPGIQDGIRQRFVNWNTQFDGSGTTYIAGNTFTITENTTLYARYTVDLSVLSKVGPAGGWVFYDAGSDQSWGRYLEAANADLTSSVWGTFNFTVTGADGTAIGTGEQNTIDIVASDTGTTNKAADRCSAYSVVYDGVTYSDWFLPSRDELDAMYDNLKAYGVGGFADYDYWSSSGYGVGSAWAQDFYDGRQYWANKIFTFYVRAARAF